MDKPETPIPANMPPEYFQHAESLEAFRLALLENSDTGLPIPFDICLQAWAGLMFCYQEWQRIAALADNHIDGLRAEVDFLHFEKVIPGGSA